MPEPVHYNVIYYYKGLIVRTEWCYDWLEAETKISEAMKSGITYDELRMIKLENTNA